LSSIDPLTHHSALFFIHDGIIFGKFELISLIGTILISFSLKELISFFNTLMNITEENIDFLSNRLGTILQCYTVYEDLIVYNVEGNFISNTSDTKILEDNVLDAMWFTNVQSTANGKSYGFDVITINQNGKDEKHLVFSCKIHKDGNVSQECIGVLAILFKWEHFAETIFKETTPI